MRNVRFECPDARISQVGNLIVVEWIGEVRSQYVAMLESSVRDVATELENRVGVLVVIRESSPLPDAAVRRHLLESLGRAEPHLSAMASLIDGEGVRAFAVRAVFNA